jgi:aromatic-L-amino-acid decarboxylase
METINKSGKMYFTHTVIKDRFVLRMSIGQTNTTEEHVLQAWRTIQGTAAELMAP